MKKHLLCLIFIHFYLFCSKNSDDTQHEIIDIQLQMASCLNEQLQKILDTEQNSVNTDAIKNENNLQYGYYILKLIEENKDISQQIIEKKTKLINYRLKAAIISTTVVTAAALLYLHKNKIYTY